MGLSEADTRAKLIDPALKKSGWDEETIRREVMITRGRLYMVGNQAQQKAPLFADYILYWRGVPVGIVEAKDDSHHPAAGLQQAKNYAVMWDVRFAYSSNGKAFVEFDFLTNTERQLGMGEFPTPAQLVSRLQSQRLIPQGQGDPLVYPYNTSTGREPRYYQDVAVRRTIRAITDGRKRLLLALATGTGKTYIASQVAWKLYKTRRIHRVLFLADRIFLRDQAYNEFGFFKGPSGDPRYAIQDELSPHSEIYFGIYQSLYAERGGKQLFREVPRDFFDLIVIDECHRSGFGTWKDILDYFEEAVQLGLTATPKRTDNVDTYAYFGDSVYSYSLGQGIQDGFLATYKVHRVKTNLDEAGGVSVEDAVIAGADLYVPEGADEVKNFYSVGEFEQKIILPDWTDRICEHLAGVLNAGDPMEKTLVFCVNMDHALNVRSRMQNHFSHLGYHDYAVRIVSEEHQVTPLLEDFRDPHRKTPVLVTTVDLLSTGVDIPPVRNVVFVRPVGSVVVFKQTVGRGTRLDAVTDKKWFRIIDYTNASRLFDDWDRPPRELEELPPKPWEGCIRLEILDAETTERIPGAWAIAVAAPNEQVELLPDGDYLAARGLPEQVVQVHLGAPGYRDRIVRLPAVRGDETELSVIELRPVKEATARIELRGVQVEIANEVIFTVDADGRQMTLAEYLAYARGILEEHLADDGELRSIWLDESKREELLSALEAKGVHVELIADLDNTHDADGYDVIRSLLFGIPLVRRAERAQAFLNHNANWLNGFKGVQVKIIIELLDTYGDGGIDQLRRRILQLERFKQHGGAVGIIKAFGGSAQFDQALGELRSRLYPAPKETTA